MDIGDPFTIERTMRLKIGTELGRVEARRLARLARPNGQGWLLRQSCLLLCAVGYLLVCLGAWLEERARPAYSPVQIEATARGRGK